MEGGASPHFASGAETRRLVSWIKGLLSEVWVPHRISSLRARWGRLH